MRNQQVEQLTEDHSVAQEKYARGELSQDEAAVHPSAHQLTRAVGAHATLRLDLRYASVHNGDRYLVCSDGVYNGMSLADIQSRLERGTPEDALKQLIDRALDLGGRDNITGIVIDTAQPTATEQH